MGAAQHGECLAVRAVARRISRSEDCNPGFAQCGSQVERSAIHTYYTYSTTGCVDKPGQTRSKGDGAWNRGQYLNSLQRGIQNQGDAQLPPDPFGEGPIELERPLLRPPAGQRICQDEISLRQ